MGKIKQIFLFIPRKIKTFFEFLKEVKVEMKKVRWSTPEELKKYTGLVILMTLLVVGYFVGLDYIIEFVKGLFSK